MVKSQTYCEGMIITYKTIAFSTDHTEHIVKDHTINEIVFGEDGISFNSVGRKRFVPYNKIISIDYVESE